MGTTTPPADVRFFARAQEPALVGVIDVVSMIVCVPHNSPPQTLSLQPTMTITSVLSVGGSRSTASTVHPASPQWTAIPWLVCATRYKKRLCKFTSELYSQHSP